MAFPSTQLAYGQRSDDVRALQNFLISQGMSIPAGATGYFGDETKAALTKWQNKNGITGAGVGTNWGPQSIAKFNSITPTSGNTGTSTPNYPGTNIPMSAQDQNTQSSQLAAKQLEAQQKEQARIGALKENARQMLQSGKGSTEIQNWLNGLPPADRNIVQGYFQGTSSTLTNAQNIFTQIQQALTNGQITQTDANRMIADVQKGIQPYLPISATSSSTGVVIGDNTAGGTITPSNTTDPKNSGIPNVPPEVMAGIKGNLVPGTLEYQAFMDQIDTAYYDIMEQQMNASTEQQRNVANYNWSKLKEYIETNLNTTLSNDAFQAWDQIAGLKNQYGAQNIQGSGLEAESIDNYLSKVRRQDSVARNEAKSKEEQANQDYMTKFATPDEVNRFIEADKAKNGGIPMTAIAWGLVPSTSVADAMSSASLKAKYPNMSDKEIEAYRTSIIDENGNYRSALYQRKMTGSNFSADLANEVTKTAPDGRILSSTVTPSDYGIQDIRRARQQYIDTSLINENLNTDLANRQLLESPKKVTDPSAGTAGGNTFNSVTPTTGSTPGSTGSNWHIGNDTYQMNPTTGQNEFVAKGAKPSWATASAPSSGTPPAGSPTASLNIAVPTSMTTGTVPSPTPSTTPTGPQYTFKTNSSGLVEKYLVGDSNPLNHETAGVDYAKKTWSELGYK